MNYLDELPSMIREAASQAEADLMRIRPHITDIQEKNTIKILEAFREERVSQWHFRATTGYGYGDDGRDKLEALYARVFKAESALVRQQIVSGTHAITLALAGNLLPGDELLAVGQPYDTLQKIIGASTSAPGTLTEYGIKYRELKVDFDAVDTHAIAAALSPATKILLIQRSRGYSWRSSLSISKIAAICQAVKAINKKVIIFVDNCYGEMVEDTEPIEAGTDLIAGSLIKNIGAGIAPGGGYIVGREDLVERAAYRLTGAGRDVGASIIDNRLYYQSLFMCPQIVSEAVSGAVFASSFLSRLGFTASPTATEPRADIIQAVKMQSREQLISFCQGIQRYSPVDSFAAPEPSPMPGYDSDIIMASGSFVHGSSIELSADAPLREPYTVFIQGGLSYQHIKYALIRTVSDMLKDNLFKI